MIKALILAAMALMLAASVSLAAGPQGIHEPGTGLVNPELKEAAQGTGQGMMADNNSNASTPGIHEPGTGLANPELKEAAQGTGQGRQEGAAQSAGKPEEAAPKAQPGFEAAFSLVGLLAVAFVALRRVN